jgi:type IV fimbrial biogenesis protein FimT
MSSIFYKSGFGLIELMATFVIVSVLLMMGLPMLNNYMEQTRADVRIMQLYNTLLFAHNTALNANQPIIICPTSNRQSCGGSWSGDLMVFTDINHNQRVDSNDRILRILEPNTAGTLTWKGFGSSNYLLFVPYGLNNQQNGTFIYCSPSHQMSLARGIIVNKSGRARLAQVTNQGGIVDGNGQEIKC